MGAACLGILHIPFKFRTAKDSRSGRIGLGHPGAVVNMPGWTRPVAKVRDLVEIYVEEHDSSIPHSAFKGQTPDEIYFERGEGVPARLAEERASARVTRMEKNRAQQCAVCA